MQNNEDNMDGKRKSNQEVLKMVLEPRQIIKMIESRKYNILNTLWDTII